MSAPSGAVGGRVAERRQHVRPCGALSYTFIWQPQVMTCRRFAAGFAAVVVPVVMPPCRSTPDPASAPGSAAVSPQRT